MVIELVIDAEIDAGGVDLPDYAIKASQDFVQDHPISFYENLARANDHAKVNGANYANDAKPPQVEAFETIRASSWHEMPVPEQDWLDHRQLIPLESSSFFVGATKIGKTYIALQAAIACASGTNWMNEPIRKGPVIFYSAEENMKVLHQRVAKICVSESIHLDALDDLHFVDLSQLVDASLIAGKNSSGSAAPNPLYHRLDTTIEAIKPVCVWLDNRGLIVTGNENDRGIASSAMRAFQLLAAKHKCAIIMIAHPSKGGEGDGSGSSGSTAWFATGRSVLFMQKPEDAEKGVRTITNTLTNYGEGDTVINVKWEFDRYKCTDRQKRAGDEIGLPQKSERVFLKLLRWHTKNNLEVSPNSRSPNYAPVVFEAAKGREGLNRKWFRTAMESLIESGVIEVRTRGRKESPVRFLVEVIVP